LGNAPVDELTPPYKRVQAVVALQPTLPATIQFPAVKAMLVKLTVFPLVIAVELANVIMLLIISPTFPAPGLAPLVIPVMTGVVIDGLVASTIPFDPVTVAAKAEATPVPYPVVPAIGNPVQLVRVPDVGVPKIGVVNVGLVVPAKEPVPDCPDKEELIALFVVTY